MAGHLPSVWPVICVALLFGCGDSKRDSTAGVSGTSPDAGGNSNPCDGLRPGPPGQPVTFKETLSISSGSLSPLGDGQGNVLTGTEGGFGQLGYSIYTPDGRLLGGAAFPPAGGGSVLSVPLASGFAGVVPSLSGPVLVRVMPDGGVENVVSVLTGGVTAADPRGGLVLVTSDALTTYDDDMRLRFTLPLQLPGVQPGQLGVDVAGNILILFGANARVYDLNGLWVDAGGNPGTVFPVAQQVIIDENVFSLAPDIRGGLFLWHQVCPGGPGSGIQCTSQWQRRYAALSTSPESAPGWLSSRPTPKLGLIHGQSGYALTGAPVPPCAFEVLTAEGMSCGFADFDARLASLTSPAAQLIANAGANPPCHSALDIGRDGTVLSLTRISCIDNSHCPVSYDWFPAYFR